MITGLAIFLQRNKVNFIDELPALITRMFIVSTKLYFSDAVRKPGRDMPVVQDIS